MLNKRAILIALNRRPLCHGMLIQHPEFSFDKNQREYCAMGALASDVGASDSYLEDLQRRGKIDGVEIWSDFGQKLMDKFGFETLEQFQTLMHANDAETFITRRNAAVRKQVEALSPEEVDELIADAPVSSESSSEGSYHYGSDD